MGGWHWLYVPGVIVAWEVLKRVVARVTGFDAWANGG